MADDATEELEAARTALSDARLLFERGGSVDGVLNRLYYACFHAARAVLYDKDETPRSHGGVRTQFGQQVVLADDAPREFGRLLRNLSDYRSVADYEGRTPDVDIAELLADAERFVEHMDDLVASG